MMWKKAVLILTVIIGTIMLVGSVSPLHVPVGDFSEPAEVFVTSSTFLPLSYPAITSFSLTGDWTGAGGAQVWLVGEGREYLVLDTSLYPLLRLQQ